MKKRFFHLGIGGTTLSAEGINQIQNVLDQVGIDWYRHGAYSWIIYADGGLDWWRDRLRLVPALSSGTATFFLSEITNYSGYLPKMGWEWLGKPR